VTCRSQLSGRIKVEFFGLPFRLVRLPKRNLLRVSLASATLFAMWAPLGCRRDSGPERQGQEAFIADVEGSISRGEDLNEYVRGPNIDDPCMYYTRLHLAALNGYADGAKLIIDHGAQLDVPDTITGATALHRAVQNGNREVAELLIANGANIEARSDFGDTPLFFAIASDDNDLSVVTLLLEAGASISATDNQRGTPLHSAAFHGDPDIVTLLIEHGADVNAKSEDGGTPLHSAAHFGHFKAMSVLLQHGAEVNATDEQGRTPLRAALVYAPETPRHHRKKAIHILLKYGARE